MQLAVEKGIIRSNPAAGIVSRLKNKQTDDSITCDVCEIEPEEEKARVLEDDQQKMLLAFIKKKYDYLYYYPLFYLLAWTGCRIGELLALTWYDIDFRNELIYIRRTLSYQKQKSGDVRRFKLKKPKTDKGNREIPMLADVKKILLSMKSQNTKIIAIDRGHGKISVEDPTPFIFKNRDGKLIHYTSLDPKLHAIIRDYNTRYPEPLPQITCHVFRHSFTCWLCENVEKGSPMETIKYIQSILGHADASVTLNIYAECRRAKRSENHELIKKLAEAY